MVLIKSHNKTFEQPVLAGPTTQLDDVLFRKVHTKFSGLPVDIQSDPTLKITVVEYINQIPSRYDFFYQIPSKAEDFKFRSETELTAYCQYLQSEHCHQLPSATTAKDFIDRRKSSSGKREKPLGEDIGEEAGCSSGRKKASRTKTVYDDDARRDAEVCIAKYKEAKYTINKRIKMLCEDHASVQVSS